MARYALLWALVENVLLTVGLGARKIVRVTLSSRS